LANSPIAPPPQRKKTSPNVLSGAEKGNLRATRGKNRAKLFAGKRLAVPGHAQIHRPVDARDACAADRCYEPFAGRFVGAIPQSLGVAITTS